MFSVNTFKFYRQYDAMDCGPTCLRMVAKHYGRSYTMETLRNRSGINRERVSLLGISEAAESIGFRTVGAKITWQQLKDQAQLPCIIYWDQVHFIVVYRIKRDKVYIADPSKGRVTLCKNVFLQHWQQHIYGQSDESDRTEQLIRDWYKQKDLEEFSSQYLWDKNNGNNEGVEQMEDLHGQWMRKEEILATPTFFINGWQLPRQYSIGDLIGLVPSLIDHVEQQEVRQKKLETDEEIVSTVTGRDKRG